MKIKVLTIITILVSLHCDIEAKVRMSSIFADGMVLQQKSLAAIWGEAKPLSAVILTTSWDKKEHTAQSDNNGCWSTKVATPRAGGPHTIVVTDPESSITLSNVLSGEVWLCSGQSNMAFRILIMNNYKQELKDTNYPKVRLFSAARKYNVNPQRNVKGEWISLDSVTQEHSAIPMLMGRELYKKLRVPIGILNVSFPGSNNEAWLPEREIYDLDSVKKILSRVRKGDNLWPGNIPTGLYNGMLHPFIPYTIKAVAWYQGEGNASHPQTYNMLLSRMISAWRKDFNQPGLPFLVCQLSGFNSPFGIAWTEIQEIQYKISTELDNVHTILTYDVGNAKDIHPKNKQEVGRRLVITAIKEVYGRGKATTQGAVLRSSEIAGNTMKLYFDNATGGIRTLGASTAINNFELAGDDGIFHPASAQIKGKDMVEVTCKMVPVPKYVRYAFHPFNADVNFYNDQMLPAVPFRTDTFELTQPILEK